MTEEKFRLLEDLIDNNGLGELIDIDKVIDMISKAFDKKVKDFILCGLEIPGFEVDGKVSLDNEENNCIVFEITRKMKDSAYSFVNTRKKEFKNVAELIRLMNSENKLHLICIGTLADENREKMENGHNKTKPSKPMKKQSKAEMSKEKLYEVYSSMVYRGIADLFSGRGLHLESLTATPDRYSVSHKVCYIDEATGEYKECLVFVDNLVDVENPHIGLNKAILRFKELILNGYFDNVKPKKSGIQSNAKQLPGLIRMTRVLKNLFPKFERVYDESHGESYISINHGDVKIPYELKELEVVSDKHTEKYVNQILSSKLDLAKCVKLYINGRSPFTAREVALKKNKKRVTFTIKQLGKPDSENIEITFILDKLRDKKLRDEIEDVLSNRVNFYKYHMTISAICKMVYAEFKEN